MLSSLIEEHRDKFKIPITAGDDEVAIKLMKLNKPPGPAGTFLDFAA